MSDADPEDEINEVCAPEDRGPVSGRTKAGCDLIGSNDKIAVNDPQKKKKDGNPVWSSRGRKRPHYLPIYFIELRAFQRDVSHILHRPTRDLFQIDHPGLCVELFQDLIGP
jgi:hypothetical protein